MIKTILVPLDGSKRAEYALPVAARFARHTDDTLVLVRAVNSAPHPLIMQATVDRELKKAATYLKKVAASPELAGLKVTRTARHGAAVPVILAAAIDYDADLIVMCSHGRTAMAHMMMGSVAETIACHASVPVLIVRKKGEPPEVSPTETSQPLRMLVPLDGTAYTETVLEPAVALLTALAPPTQKTALHLVRIVKSTPDENDEMWAAEKYLSTVKDRLTKQHLAVSWSVLNETDIARGITQTRALAENGEDTKRAYVFEECELIAMSNHGQEGLSLLMIGSVTERVSLHCTKCPILIFQPSEEDTNKSLFFNRHEVYRKDMIYVASCPSKSST
jgi:nucleotide-binding universal stress UspA family protein